MTLSPSGLGWVTFDIPVQVLTFMGLAFLLFLVALDVELGRLRGRLLQLVGLGAGRSKLLSGALGRL